MNVQNRSISPTCFTGPEAYAASHAQRRLWVLQEMNPSLAAYNICGAILLDGSLDAAAFATALQDLVDRHESLRTTFAARGDQLCQLVHLEAAVAFEEVDLSSTPDPHSAARQLIAHDFAQPFNLSRGPLFRAKLLHLAAGSHVFSYNFHHVITDDTSQMVLVRELSALYSARARRMPNPLPPLEFQYKDFTAWQNEELTGPDAARHREYWLDKFAGELPILELATDFPRPAIKTFAGRTFAALWEPEFLYRLEQFARTEKATLFLVLLALVRVQLFRYTNQNDIVIGTPVAGRDLHELENQIGFYANTLPLRQYVRAGDSFCALLEREKESFAEAYDHQLFPFDQLVSDLNVRRDLSRAPVFEVSVHLRNIDVAELQLGSLRISEFPIKTSSAKLDLSYDFIADATGLHCGLTYNIDLFRVERVRAMHSHLRRLAEEVLRNPQQRIDRLTMLTQEEQAQILTGFNPAKVSWPETTIVEMFEAEVTRHPAAEAVACDETRLTFAELNARANRLANYLINQGVGLESRVGVFLERSVDWLVALLAVMKAGAVYVPLNSSYPLDRLAQLLADARPPVILTNSDLEDHLPVYFARAINLDLEWEDQIATASPDNPALPLLPRNGAYLIYTSGTTGKPKGVLVEHGGFTNMICDQIERFCIRGDNRALQFASVSFDASMYELFLALLAGVCIVPIPRSASSEGDSFLRFLETERITISTLPPSFLRTVGTRALGPMRLLITAGEAAAADICTEIARTGRCINAYGPTEASVCVSCHAVSADGDYRAGVPIGRPISNDQVYILDAALNPVPIGIPGELCVGGAGLARGYLDQPDLTANVFRPDPFGPNPGGRLYHTGDLARWLPNGEIEFLGRKDQQVKVRGHRIELGEVETALNQLPDVREAIVTVRAGPDGNQRLVAYVVAASSPLSIPALRIQLLNVLPESSTPDVFVEVSAFPLNAAGKIDRKLLPALESARGSDTAAPVEPRTDLERVLAGVFAKVLGLAKVGIHDSFFDLGGNSLMATQAVSRIRDLLRVDLSVPTLFESPGIEELAARLLREQAVPDRLEKVARVVVRYQSLSEEEKSAVIARARERAGQVTVQ
jgi:amino acid adenylation domain-containing protein